MARSSTSVRPRRRTGGRCLPCRAGSPDRSAERSGQRLFDSEIDRSQAPSFSPDAGRVAFKRLIANGGQPQQEQLEVVVYSLSDRKVESTLSTGRHGRGPRPLVRRPVRSISADSTNQWHVVSAEHEDRPFRDIQSLANSRLPPECGSHVLSLDKTLYLSVLDPVPAAGHGETRSRLPSHASSCRLRPEHRRPERHPSASANRDALGVGRQPRRPHAGDGDAAGRLDDAAARCSWVPMGATFVTWRQASCRARPPGRGPVSLSHAMAGARRRSYGYRSARWIVRAGRDQPCTRRSFLRRQSQRYARCFQRSQPRWRAPALGLRQPVVAPEVGQLNADSTESQT